MRSLLSIRIKEQLLKKKNLAMLLIIPLMITFICTYLDNEARDPSKVYSVAIIDYDITELSTFLIDNMEEYSEIEIFIEEDLEQSLKKLSRGKYDVVYEIKDGFQNRIQSGEFNDILVSHKEVNSTAVKWLNDQISLLVVREWLYVDALGRILSLDPDFREEEFRSKFEESMVNNKILSLKIHEASEDEGMLQEDTDSIGEATFKTLWSSIIIFFLISFGKRVVDDRERGIIVRLELSGLSKIEYYTTSLILQLLNVIIPFAISYFMMGYFSFKNIGGFFMTLLLTTIYTIFTWILILLIGYLFDSKRSYNFASQVFLLVSIIFGIGLLGGMFKIIDYMSWLLPIKWYMHL